VESSDHYKTGRNRKAIRVGKLILKEKFYANIRQHSLAHPFMGFLTAAVTFLIGGLLVITVIGAPIGLGLIQLSKFY
jgi:hypothetical protein